MNEEIDLNFSCEPGDLIQVRSRVIVCGSQYFSTSTWKKDEWNQLGSEFFLSWSVIDDHHFTLCLVTAKHVFPDEAWNLNYLELLLFDGRTGRIFDDPRNGFWIPFSQVEQCPKVREVAMNAWMKRKPSGSCWSRYTKHLHARG